MAERIPRSDPGSGPGALGDVEDRDCSRLLNEKSSDFVARLTLDGVFLEVSPSVASILGIRPGDLIGQDAFELLHLDDVATARRAQSDVVERVGMTTVVYRVATPSGGWVWLETMVRVVRDPDTDDLTELRSVSRDVSERVEAERALAESERRFRLAFDNAPIGMALVSLDGQFLEVNGALTEFLACSAEQLLACTFQDLTHEEDLEADLEHLESTLRGDCTSYRMQKRYRRPDGSIVWGDLAVALVRDVGGAPLHFISQIVDVTAIKAVEAELAELALRDPLTGIANRTLLDRQLADALERSSSVSVLYVDLDGFKEVNDSRGHAAGDELLRQAAERISRAVRSSDLVARYGGDEFTVLCDGLDAAAVQPLAERIVRGFLTPFLLDGTPTRIGVSVGVAGAGQQDTVHSLVARADTAMYHAKTAPRRTLADRVATR